MPLNRRDTVTILRFCMGVGDAGTAQVTEGGTHLVTVELARAGHDVQAFYGASYEEALRSAAAAGALSGACIDKQIAFMARHDPGHIMVASVSPPPPQHGEVEGLALFRELLRVVAALLHETQRERGLSSLFAGSGGRIFADELGLQRRRTDLRQVKLRGLLTGAAEDAPAGVKRRLARALALLDEAGPLREAMDRQIVPVSRIIETYSTLNTELLAAVDACMVARVIGQLRSTALACVALQHAKEKTGIERARLGTALLRHGVTGEEQVIIGGLVAARASYLHIFATAAPRPAEQLLRRALASPAAVEVRRIEEQLRADAAVDLGIDAEAWFRTMSRKIEMLGDVGDAALSMLSPEP